VGSESGYGIDSLTIVISCLDVLTCALDAENNRAEEMARSSPRIPITVQCKGATTNGMKRAKMDFDLLSIRVIGGRSEVHRHLRRARMEI
jgi:hypothetical protein